MGIHEDKYYQAIENSSKSKMGLHQTICFSILLANEMGNFLLLSGFALYELMPQFEC